MPLIGTLITALFSKFFAVVAFLIGARHAARLTAAVTLAGIYLACVVTFTEFVAPLWDALLSTPFGMILGLLFPSIAGTILAGLNLYRICVVGVSYTTRLTKMVVG